MLTPNTKAPKENLLKYVAIIIGLILTIFLFKAIFPSGIAISRDPSEDTLNSIDTNIYNPQSSALYAEFSSNKVAFDKKYKDKTIEFEGEITKITNDSGCATVKIKVSENPFEYITCNNCPADEDKWSDEVSSVSVGQTVLIKGYYSAFSSSENTMFFYKCHILK